MHSVRICLVFIFLSQWVCGQEHKKFMEVGLTLFTANKAPTSQYIEQPAPDFEYVNGIFLRYTINRFGIRAFASYTQYQYKGMSSLSYASSFDSYGNALKYRDLKLGLGGQYLLFRKCEWLYAFTDAAYNKILMEGSLWDDGGRGTYSYSGESSGVRAYFGMGAGINFLKVMRISPELSYSILFSRTNTQNEQIPVRNVEMKNEQLHLKFHLTFRF